MHLAHPAEPWVSLDTETDFRAQSGVDPITASQCLRQEEKYRFYRLALDMVKANEISGDYFEFGCHRVRTFRMALTEARRQGLDRMHFHAFDSFQGLPADDSDHGVHSYQTGNLKTEEDTFWKLVTSHGIYTDRIHTHKGFYQESLTPELQGRLTAAGTKPALICVDCDLIASTTPVFNFIAPFLQEGAIIYIDDYYVGYKGNPLRSVARTWTDFTAEHRTKWHFEPLLNVGWWGRSFIACS